ncbi:uncharacterized protein [Heterodontus francisci]|uniref:uncharacterized protein n=1 Tax=Heterodontus francisci TaxID=7792 RepID=UPI00355C7A1D
MRLVLGWRRAILPTVKKVHLRRRRKERQLQPATQLLLYRQNQWTNWSVASGKKENYKEETSKKEQVTIQTSGKRRLLSETDYDCSSSLDEEGPERRRLQKKWQKRKPPSSGALEAVMGPAPPNPKVPNPAHPSKASGTLQLREASSSDVFEEEQRGKTPPAEDSPNLAAHKTPLMSPQRNQPPMGNQEGFLNVKQLVYIEYAVTYPRTGTSKDTRCGTYTEISINCCWRTINWEKDALWSAQNLLVFQCKELSITECCRLAHSKVQDYMLRGTLKLGEDVAKAQWEKTTVTYTWRGIKQINIKERNKQIHMSLKTWLFRAVD